MRTSGTSGDTKLYLLNSEGAQINYNDDGGDGFFSLISESRLEAGTYYGYVSAFSTASEIPAYQLTYTAESLIQIDAQEPNDSTSEATALTGQTATGSLHTPEDIDVYVVSIPDNAEVNLNSSRTSGSATVSLLDESGSAVSTSSPTGSSSETTLSANRPPAGTYYIQIESVDGLVENYTLSFEALIYPTIPADIVVDVSAGGDISISWTAVPGATSYDIEYFYSGDLSEPNAANWQVATKDLVHSVHRRLRLPLRDFLVPKPHSSESGASTAPQPVSGQQLFLRRIEESAMNVNQQRLRILVRASSFFKPVSSWDVRILGPLCQKKLKTPKIPATRQRPRATSPIPVAERSVQTVSYHFGWTQCLSRWREYAYPSSEQSDAWRTGTRIFVSLSPTDVTIQAGGASPFNTPVAIRRTTTDSYPSVNVAKAIQRFNHSYCSDSRILRPKRRLAGADINSGSDEHSRCIPDKPMCL